MDFCANNNNNNNHSYLNQTFVKFPKTRMEVVDMSLEPIPMSTKFDNDQNRSLVMFLNGGSPNGFIEEQQTCCNNNNPFIIIQRSESPAIVSTNGDTSDADDDHYSVTEPTTTTPSTQQQQQQKDPKKVTDSMIAQALSQLSMKERDEVYHEIHGVSNRGPEDPQQIQEQIRQVKEIIHSKLGAFREARLGGGGTGTVTGSLAAVEALHEAIQQNPTYIDSDAMYLGFLRAEAYDVELAAKRMVMHFEWKKDSFGMAKVGKEIGYEDLEPEDIRALKEGYVQKLNVRDRAGRAIIFMTMKAEQNYASTASVGRIFYWTFMMDEETERNGAVFIVFHLSNSFQINEKRIACVNMASRATNLLRCRLSALHHCFIEASPGLILMTQLAIQASPKSTRSKARIHTSSKTEIEYLLLTFGVHNDAIPLTADGKIKTANLNAYIKARKELQKLAKNGITNGVELPSNNDVLLGKGKHPVNQIGNQRLHCIVDDMLQKYEDADRNGKTQISLEVVHKIHQESGGKFLMKENGVWREVSDEEARDRVSSMFRRSRRKATSSTSTTTTTTISSSNNSNNKATKTSYDAKFGMSGESPRSVLHNSDVQTSKRVRLGGP